MHDVRLDPTATKSIYRLRVRFCDTDLMGIAHHAKYLVYFEAGRVDWLRRRGITYASWAERGIHLPVVEASVRYRAPAHFDEVLDVETRLAELRSVSLRFNYRLTREDTLLAEGMTRLACVDASHHLRRFLPDDLRVFRAHELVPSEPEVQ
jgi:acyl-CoA thioester hydrolase